MTATPADTRNAADTFAAIRAKADASLRRWAAYSERWWYDCPDRSDLGCYGTGYGQWGAQTNQKYLGAMAVLASLPDGDGLSRDLALARTIKALRYSNATHPSGDYVCLDNKPMAAQWILALGIERMMHGIDRIDDALPADDRRRVREVLAYEADAQCAERVHAGPWNHLGGNKPESNIWNGAILARAALHNPESHRAGIWLDKAHEFFLNGISIRADAEDETIYRGKPLKEWHIDANFFPHYALDHHGYLNVGYMVICLSNIAMLHFAYKRRGQEAPAALYLHAEDLWKVVKGFLFGDARLARIGGDTRVRYCYCQDYIIPTLLLAMDLWNDPHGPELLENAVDLIRLEQETNKDGSFHGERMAHLARESAYYFTRLESDKAVVLSMALDWLEMVAPPAPPQEEFCLRVSGPWSEPEHGAAMHRSPTRLASWSWRAAHPPQGLCLPPNDGHMAEWTENLAGGYDVPGQRDNRKVREHGEWMFDGGFVTVGAVDAARSVVLYENCEFREPLVDQRLCFCALPDGHTCIQMELGLLPRVRLYLTGMQGVKLEIPNDRFTRGRRYVHAGGEIALEPYRGERQVIGLDSRWLNVDGKLGLVGLYGADSWSLLRRGAPIGGWPHSVPSIRTDTLCFGIRDDVFDVTGPAILQDYGVALLASVDADGTRALCESQTAEALPCPAEMIRAVRVTGRNGTTYALVVNFGDTDEDIILDALGDGWQNISHPEAAALRAGETLRLPRLSARLFGKG